ncbi:MAG TPA: transcriptional regulator GcvA [Aestuariivirgaceae bacterium]|nr:transcriptional regulator GcvA [Aestuariivirgaceae bacterium]
MPRRLPPLNSLPSFEAAARHLSFSKAAEELHVTHGAVSRAVRHLETQLGVQLFTRKVRSVALTTLGASYAAEVRQSLDHLAAATLAMSGQQSSVLTVSTLDAFASKWLVPRLFKFRLAHGGIDIRLSTSEKLADFVSDGIEIAIRYGRGQYPGVRSELLMQEDLSPVCSPALLDGPHPLRNPTDLIYHTLIHDDFPIDWAMWLRMAGIEGIDPHKGPSFYASEHVVQAAVQGEGVALGRSSLVDDDIAAGRLVRPFEFRLSAGLAYYLVYPPGALKRQKVKNFRDWIMEEVAGQSLSPTSAATIDVSMKDLQDLAQGPSAWQSKRSNSSV